MSQLRCIWCMKDIPSSPCPICKQTVSVVEKFAPHVHHWSRKTISTMECKQCEKVIVNTDYFEGNFEYETK
jgi:C4-type Zn-finger protein